MPGRKAKSWADGRDGRRCDEGATRVRSALGMVSCRSGVWKRNQDTGLLGTAELLQGRGSWGGSRIFPGSCLPHCFPRGFPPLPPYNATKPPGLASHPLLELVGQSPSAMIQCQHSCCEVCAIAAKLPVCVCQVCIFDSLTELCAVGGLFFLHSHFSTFSLLCLWRRRESEHSHGICHAGQSHAGAGNIHLAYAVVHKRRFMSIWVYPGEHPWCWWLGFTLRHRGWVFLCCVVCDRSSKVRRFSLLLGKRRRS